MNPTLSYMSAYPDVWKAYNKNSYGMNPGQYAQTHYQNYGQREQRYDPNQVSNYFRGAGVPLWFQQASMNWKNNPSTNAKTLQGQWKQYDTPNYRGISPDKFQDYRTAYQKELTNRGIYGDQYGEHMKYMNDPDVRLAAMKASGATPWKPQSSYMLNNPDVAQAYNQNNYGMTPKQFSQAHYQNFGQAEQRQAPARSWAPNDTGFDMDYTSYNPNPVISRGREGVDGQEYLSVNNQRYYGDDQINRIQSQIANPPQYNTVDGPRQMEPDQAALFAKQQAEARPLEQIQADAANRMQNDPKFAALVNAFKGLKF